MELGDAGRIIYTAFNVIVEAKRTFAMGNDLRATCYSDMMLERPFCVI
jgi:hypothetical protein